MKAMRIATIQQGWPIIVRHIMENGDMVQDERGSNTMEILNLFVEYTDPENAKEPEGNPFGGRKLEAYEDEFTSDDKGDFVYTYGNRYRAHFGFDQIAAVIGRLTNCAESRRSIAITWDPVEDSKSEEVPCNIYADFKIRKGMLFTTAMWRSHDIFTAYVPNFFALLRLSQLVAKWLNIEIGVTTIHSISAHIYEGYWDEAKKI